MSTRLVQIGHLAVATRPDERIKTIGLGSCVAVIIIDAIRGVAGMAHVVLPSARGDDPASKPEGYYADTAVTVLLKKMSAHGSSPRTGPLTVKITGGAAVGEQRNSMNIGKRNVLAVKRALWRHRLTPIAELVGGHDARTVTVDVGTQSVVVTVPNKEPEEL
ncbi:MAG: chemotaxis protein CheD [Myxococcales bacterium FL481]|nr:MAG: chemotaxis protein CheD [Myxococcales bacterium FL481]